MNDGETVAEYQARVAQIQANRFGFFDSENGTSGSAEETGAVIEYEPMKAGDSAYALGMDYEEGRDMRTASEKLSNFVQAAGKLATDPEVQKAYSQGQFDKLIGIGEGLNLAKNSTKAAMAAGWQRR